MALELIVTQPFRSYARGDVISDPDTVQEIESSSHYSKFVVRIESKVSVARTVVAKGGE